MNDVLVIYKRRGETPLQSLQRLREEKPEYKNETLSYAGRLDPMAEGVMLILVGEANKEREKYLSLDKTYITQILCGISTDTHDLLGMITDINPNPVTKKDFTGAVDEFMGSFSQKYPAFSSKTVGGTALHELSRTGEEFEFPVHNVSLYSVSLISTRKIPATDTLESAIQSTKLVKGDFRQREIKDKWNNEISRYRNIQFDLFEVELSVSSGFYVRQFASDIGEKLGLPALAFSIIRTRAGEWTV